MERPDRNEKDDAQKAKLVFISLAVVVIVVLIWSLVAASNAKKERDAAVQKLDSMSQAYEKDEQLLKEQSVMIDDLKKKVQQLEAKAKAKPVAKKNKSSKGSTKKSSKKSSKTGKHK